MPAHSAKSTTRRSRYNPPPPGAMVETTLAKLVAGRRLLREDQTGNRTLDESFERAIWYTGTAELLQRSCVAVVGTREPSAEGAARARRLARELAAAGVVVVSGLANGIDTEALTSAMDAGGKVVGVIGTPLDESYPIVNAELQERIAAEHLLVSQFRIGTRTFPEQLPAAQSRDGTVQS